MAPHNVEPHDYGVGSQCAGSLEDTHRRAEVAPIGPNDNSWLFVRYGNSHCVGTSISARIEALPWARHAEFRLAPGTQTNQKL